MLKNITETDISSAMEKLEEPTRSCIVCYDHYIELTICPKIILDVLNETSLKLNQQQQQQKLIFEVMDVFFYHVITPNT